LKRRSQRRWSERHPDYWSARRLSEQLSASRDPVPSPSRPLRGPPPQIREIPVEVVQDEMGAQVLVILVFLAKLQHRAAQDEIQRQLRGITKQLARLPPQLPQDETAPEEVVS
jgi:hypothetical protein